MNFSTRRSHDLVELAHNFALPIPRIAPERNVFSRRSTPDGSRAYFEQRADAAVNSASRCGPRDARQDFSKFLARPVPSNQAKDSPSFTCNDTSCSAQTSLPFSGAATRWANTGTLPANGAAHRPLASTMYRFPVLSHEYRIHRRKVRTF